MINLNTPFFGIALTLISFVIGVRIYNKIKLDFLPPFLIAIIIMGVTLVGFDIPFKEYALGGDMIGMLLIPASCALSLAIYKELKILKKNIFPILIGSFVGAFSSVFSVSLMCKVFNLSDSIKFSLLPKSVTIPIAIDLSTKYTGIESVTIFAVCVTGILGAVFAPILVKVLKLKNKVGIGLAIGASSHGIGTAKAIEMGEIEGAISSISIGISGLMTILIYLFI